jgi:molybdopterin converting factor subunit 1
VSTDAADNEITVLFFARARDLAGTEKILLRVSPRATVRELGDRLTDLHPRLAEIVPRCRFALDREFVELDSLVGSAKEAAVLPPVSGG